MRMLRTQPFFPPKSGEKPYLEVFSRFGWWRNFLNDIYKQQFLLSDWLKQCQLIPNQWNFTSATLNHFRLVFFYHNIKDNEISLYQDLLIIENTDSDLKVHALHYANEPLVRVRFSFQNFCKIAQHTEIIRNVWEKSIGMHSLLIRVQTTINHISIFTCLCFFTAISRSKKMLTFRARTEKGIARHIDASGVVGTW